MLGLNTFWRKPRQFEYKPRFFDPEKEAREERKRELLEDGKDVAEAADKEYRPGEYIRRNIYARRGIGSSRGDASKKAANTRKYVLAGLVLLLIIWWLV